MVLLAPRRVTIVFLPVTKRSSHHRAPLLKNRPGFLLIEMTLGMTLLVVFLGAFAISLIEGQLGGQTSGNRVRGTEQALKAMEVTYNMRDENFSLLTMGPHGTTLDSVTGRWTFSGSQLVSSGGYATVLTINRLQSDMYFLKSNTSWKISPTRDGDINISGLVTNWQKARPVGKWSTVTLTGSYVDGGTPSFNSLVVSDGYAFVTSENTGGGRGLYVLNVQNPQNPVHSSTGFTLAYAAYGAAIRGKMLYIVTSDANNELKAYDITNPHYPILRISKNLPGSGVARSLAVYGTYLIVGATDLGTVAAAPKKSEPVASSNYAWLMPKAEAATICFAASGSVVSCASLSSSSTSSSSSVAASSGAAVPAGNDVYIFDIRSPSEILFLSALNASGVNSIALSGTSALLASDNGTAELRIVDLENPTAIAFALDSENGAPEGGYNLSDRNTLRGTAVAVSGTSALLGTQYASLIQEFLLFDAEGSGVPPSSPAPLYYSTSGSIVGIASDPTACYAYIATTRKDTALQIVTIKGASVSSLATYVPPAPGNFAARNLYYDPVRDLLYLINRKGIYILSPAVGPNDCP